jgi:CBS domain-containing protein
MKIEELMIRDVKSCGPGDSLGRAAQIMWEHDCGALPVVEGGKLVGMLTDRDVCMGARSLGLTLGELSVADSMTRRVWTCWPEDTLDAAVSLMRNHKVRRLPVVDRRGRLVGILSLDDLAREVARERKLLRSPQITAHEVAETLAAICEPQFPLNPETAVIEAPRRKDRKPRTSEELLAARQREIEC